MSQTPTSETGPSTGPVSSCAAPLVRDNDTSDRDPVTRRAPAPAELSHPTPGATARTAKESHVNVIRLNVPPDQTPQEEADLVAAAAAAYTESTGSTDVTVEVNRTEEVAFQRVATLSSRWAS